MIKCTKKETKDRDLQHKPLHPNISLSTVATERLIATIKDELKKNKQLRSGVAVDSDMDADFSNIFENNFDSLSPFVKMFWKEQKRHFQSPSGRRYHPMLIRFALSIATKSPAVYEEMRNSGVLNLPSMRILRDYHNFIQPKSSFNPAVVLVVLSDSLHFHLMTGRFSV